MSDEEAAEAKEEEQFGKAFERPAPQVEPIPETMPKQSTISPLSRSDTEESGRKYKATRSSVCLHRSLICSLRTACFAHSLTRGKVNDQMSR